MHILVLNISEGRLSGGYRKYLEQLMPRLQNHPKVSDLDVLVHPQVGQPAIEGVSVESWPLTNHAGRTAWIEQRVRERSPDVVFIPTARLLRCRGVPVVCMVRNMEPLIAPFRGNRLKDAAINVARARVARRACRSATRTIAVSCYVRDFVVDRWGIDPARVGVVYHGVEPPPAVDESARPDALRGVEPGSFLFTAGSLRPARGLADAIEAVALLHRAGKRYRLVVGGGPNPGTEFYVAKLKKLAASRGIGTDVIWAGQLDVREMTWCFQNCMSFVMTSRAEACPNLVLEAMSCGCLSVSTDQPPMGEFFGDSSLYYSAGDASDLARAIQQLDREDEEARRRRRAAALVRSERFTWQDTADATVAELSRALTENP